MDLGACKESDMTEQLSIAQHRIKWKCFKSRTSDIKVEKWGGVFIWRERIASLLRVNMILKALTDVIFFIYFY